MPEDPSILELAKAVKKLAELVKKNAEHSKPADLKSVNVELFNKVSSEISKKFKAFGFEFEKKVSNNEQQAEMYAASAEVLGNKIDDSLLKLRKSLLRKLNKSEKYLESISQSLSNVDKVVKISNKKDDEPREVVQEKEKVFVDGYSPDALNEMASALKQDANNILQLPEGVDIDKESIWKNRFWYGFVGAGIAMILTSMGMEMRSLVASLGIGAAIPNIIKGVSNSLKEGGFLRNIATTVTGLITGTFKALTSPLRKGGAIYESAATVLNKIAETRIGKFTKDILKTFTKGFKSIFSIIPAAFGEIKFGEHFDKIKTALKDNKWLKGIISGGKAGGVWLLKKLPVIGLVISLGEAAAKMITGEPAKMLSGVANVAAGIAYLFPGVGTAIGLGIDFLNYLYENEAEEFEEREGRPPSFFESITTLIWGMLKKAPMIGWAIKSGEAIQAFVTAPSLEGFGKVLMTTLAGDPAMFEAAKWLASWFYDVDGIEMLEDSDSFTTAGGNAIANAMRNVWGSFKETSFYKYLSNVGGAVATLAQNPSIENFADFLDKLTPGDFEHPVSSILRLIDSGIDWFTAPLSAGVPAYGDISINKYMELWVNEKIIDPFFDMIDQIGDLIQEAIDFVSNKIDEAFGAIKTPGEIYDTIKDAKAVDEQSEQGRMTLLEKRLKALEEAGIIMKREEGFIFDESDEDFQKRVDKAYIENIKNKREQQEEMPKEEMQPDQSLYDQFEKDRFIEEAGEAFKEAVVSAQTPVPYDPAHLNLLETRESDVKDLKEQSQLNNNLMQKLIDTIINKDDKAASNNTVTSAPTYNYNFSVEGGISTFRKGVANDF